MMKKKTVLSLDSRYNTMIENAFYYSNPPTNQVTVKEVKNPMHEYIRKLLFKDLNKITTERVHLHLDDTRMSGLLIHVLTG